MLNRIKEGKVREWKAYYDSRFSDTEAFQGLLMDRDVDKFLKNADEVWANAMFQADPILIDSSLLFAGRMKRKASFILPGLCD